MSVGSTAFSRSVAEPHDPGNRGRGGDPSNSMHMSSPRDGLAPAVPRSCYSAGVHAGMPVRSSEQQELQLQPAGDCSQG